MADAWTRIREVQLSEGNNEGRWNLVGWVASSTDVVTALNLALRNGVGGSLLAPQQLIPPLRTEQLILPGYVLCENGIHVAVAAGSAEVVAYVLP